MKMILFLSICLISSMSFSQTNHERLLQLEELKRISFGSCNDQRDEQPLWQDLIKQRPDLWIWGGDNVYADWKNEEAIRLAYEKQNSNSDYQRFKSLTPIIGTWDDHDFAFDNASGSYQFKKASQQLALDFLEEPSDSPRRSQEGIYTSYEFGEKQRKIKIILLDNRYFKGLEPEYPMLGKVQWEWLEKELTNSSAKIHFIVTGLPVLSPLIPYTEEWAHTNELDRMLNLLKKTGPQGVVFLVGDKHFSSFYQRWGNLEFMSSGMTHVARRNTWWYLGRKYPRTFFGLSYGQIDIAWEEEIPLITLSMRNTTGRDIHKKTYRWTTKGWRKI